MTTPHPRGATIPSSIPRLRPTLLILAALLLMAFGEAAAQQAPSPITRSVLVYTVSAVLSPAESGGPAQAALVERLGRDPRLASLSIEKPDNRVQARVVARFVFESEGDFQRWMAGDGGRMLTEALSRAESQSGSQLELRRFPVAELLRLTS